MSILIIILLVTSGLIGLMCLIWMVVLGFQRHWGWGLALLFPVIGRVVSLLPMLEGKAPLQIANYSLQVISLIVYVSFLVVAWPETKPPFFWQLTGWLLLALGLGLYITSNTPRPASPGRAGASRKCSHRCSIGSAKSKRAPIGFARPAPAPGAPRRAVQRQNTGAARAHAAAGFSLPPAPLRAARPARASRRNRASTICWSA